MRLCIVSTYELGRPAFEAAQIAARFPEAAHRDLSRGDLVEDDAWDAFLFLVPMHTATRLALEEMPKLIGRYPKARIIAAGLYGPLNEKRLLRAGAHQVLGPEFEDDLVHALVDAPLSGARVRFSKPARAVHGRLARFSRVIVDGRSLIAGATQSTRGCKHRCRHCPIVPVYKGALRAVPVATVIDDVEQQVALGAKHITFSDPDFLNAPTHAARVLDEMESRFPELGFDLTAKVEHLRDQGEMVERLAAGACRFVTTAVESFDDEHLALLDKGHTRDDFVRVLSRCRDLGLVLNPTFLPFAPWTTLDGYARFLDELHALELFAETAPVQLSIRLLLPAGSLLLEHVDAEAFDEDALAHPWRHRDPRVDELQREISAAISAEPDRELQQRAALEVAGPLLGRNFDVRTASCTTPYLEEPWYC